MAANLVISLNDVNMASARPSAYVAVPRFCMSKSIEQEAPQVVRWCYRALTLIVAK